MCFVDLQGDITMSTEIFTPPSSEESAELQENPRPSKAPILHAGHGHLTHVTLQVLELYCCSEIFTLLEYELT